MLLLVLRSILDVTAQNNLKKVDLPSVEGGVEFAREKLKDAQSERIKQILTPKMRDILECIISEKGGGPVVGTSLSDELGMDQGNLSRYLNQMAALNFLNKHRDGRIVSFEIKPELKLIGMSGGGKIGSEYVESTAKKFFSYFLTKPFSRADFIEAVETSLGTELEPNTH